MSFLSRHEDVILKMIDFILPFMATVVIAVLLAIPEYVAWNWIMPRIFGAETVAYWQSIGVTFVATFIVKRGFRFFRPRKQPIPHYKASSAYTSESH